MNLLGKITNDKPTFVKFAEDIDFYKLFEKIEQENETCFLLESLGKYSDLSRYSIIGFDPLHMISAQGNNLIVDGEKKVTENPYFSLSDIIPQDNMSRDYAGGLIGYMNYDTLNYLEPSIKVQTHVHFDQFMFGVYTDGLILDKRTNEILYFFYDKNRLSDIAKIANKNLVKKHLSATFKGYGLNKKEHATAVEQVKKEILAGNTFQCQVGFKSEFQLQGDTIESIKIIDRMEKEARGPYGGAVGHFGFNGDCTFAISIRSLYVSGNYAYSQTSGGIVYDSQPEAEYQEIMRKSQAIKEVLGV